MTYLATSHVISSNPLIKYAPKSFCTPLLVTVIQFEHLVTVYYLWSIIKSIRISLYLLLLHQVYFFSRQLRNLLFPARHFILLYLNTSLGSLAKSWTRSCHTAQDVLSLLKEYSLHFLGTHFIYLTKSVENDWLYGENIFLLLNKQKPKTPMLK